jgi:hypothetical protein
MGHARPKDFRDIDDVLTTDAKIGATWGPEIPLPFDANRTLKAAFMREVRARHKACLKSSAS